MSKIFYSVLSLSLIAAAALTACGGGGGGASAGPEVATTSITGVVADGYLTGVKVCLDKNENMVCDAGEPFATTGAGGAYTITGVAAGDEGKYPLVAEVPATATDTDSTAADKTVGKAFVLSAPTGNTTVTPLSALVQQEQQATPALSAASASANVKTALGITSDPLADYIAKPDADAHIRAQMIAESLKANSEVIGAGTTAQRKTQQGVLLTLAKQSVAALAPAAGASAPTAVPVVGVEDANTLRATLASKLSTGAASQTVTVNFDVVNGATSVRGCDVVTLNNLKLWDKTPLASSQPAVALTTPVAQATPGQLVGLRFYISNVLLWDANGNAVPLEMTEDAGQSKNVALMDFGYNTAAYGATPSCTTAYKTAITGKVVPGNYTGISFTLGVPVRSADLSTKLNHVNAADTASPAPLQNLAMSWTWQSGRKFTKIEFVPTTPFNKPTAANYAATGSMWNVHIGSTGCQGNPATTAGVETACTNPNRLSVQFNSFNAATQKIALDVGVLFGSADLTYDGGSSSGCMSGTTDPECAPIFKALGLGLTGANAGRTLTGAQVQTVFSVK